LTDTQIVQIVAAGASRPKEVYCACGGRAQCGNCTATILSIIRSAEAEMRMVRPAA